MQQAARLFANDGFDRTAISTIAEQCHVSKALFYHYYPSKDALLFDIIHSHILDLVTSVEAANDPALPPKEALGQLIGGILDAYRDADAEHKIQLNELGKLPEDQQETIRALERRLVNIVVQAIIRVNPALGETRHANLSKPVAMALFGILNWTYHWFRDGRAMTREAYAAMVTKLFVAGLEQLAE